VVKKTITDRNGDKVEKELHVNAKEVKAEKNSPAAMIPHEKANAKSAIDSPDKILPSYKRPR